MTRDTTLVSIPAWGDHALAVHGGAGPRRVPLTQEQRLDREAGLRAALTAGQAVLAAGGSAADAVCAAVAALEDCPLFNAGIGAALTEAGTAELDACLMTGEGAAGAVTVANRARHPIDAARAVAEQTRHVLIAAPSAERLRAWGVAVAEPGDFITETARENLTRSLPEASPGTVGAVARDAAGRVAAATSTGGMSGQLVGRIGDSPVPGAGTFAHAQTVAVSGTGVGEFFLRGALAHDIHARMRYSGAGLADAVTGSIGELLTDRGGDGGVIAVTPAGEVVLAFNSEKMYRGALTADGMTVST